MFKSEEASNHRTGSLVLADSPLLSASAGGHLLNSLAACCFSPFSVNIGCLLFCTNIIFIPKFPSSVNIESRSFEGCSYECNIEGDHGLALHK